MAKKPRILTKEWAHSLQTTGGLETEADPGPWLLQEDVEVIGWSIRVKVYPTLTQNGLQDGYGELSQAPHQTMDGALEGVRVCYCHQAEVVGGSAAMTGAISDTKTTFLPSGEAITMKEGEYLSLHCQIETPAGENGMVAAGVIVYYRKAT